MTKNAPRSAGTIEAWSRALRTTGSEIQPAPRDEQIEPLLEDRGLSRHGDPEAGVLDFRAGRGNGGQAIGAFPQRAVFGGRDGDLAAADGVGLPEGRRLRR